MRTLALASGQWRWILVVKAAGRPSERIAVALEFSLYENGTYLTTLNFAFVTRSFDGKKPRCYNEKNVTTALRKDREA